ncbi:QsdR family transcriptional regulator [Allokutzneria sp. A3M-2-11 16]|uniref:QsdR family transcriptional regulator n=1 Tax=Allokutzneria sp. A3M-2-11 16 TaxID=2962043 RepID=UPI0020B8371B|nr:QsdR family transcriptional regulator [Allokutzneria sp. A3M-2-11 16]MCP3805538.1 QsdR family transcriptional regulator [Allokutzneria sp. A3M-2-11 16]
MARERSTPIPRQDTPLGRALREGRAPSAKATLMDVFDLARRWFLEGRRLDMCQLAAELGISRATLYRWCGSRELLLGELIWRLTHSDLERVRAGTPGGGKQCVVDAITTWMTRVRSQESLLKFVTEDPEYALRIMTTKQSVVQPRLIQWCADFLRAELDLRPDIDVDDLAYAIVRVCESFVWSDVITGAPPETLRAIPIVEILISAAESPVRVHPSAG